MVHVDDLRLPLPPGVLEHARLDHVQHVGVAVVVVADVLLIQPRQARELVRRADVLHVPLGDHLVAVGIDRRPQQDDDVVEHRFGIGVVRAVDQVVEQLRDVRRTGDFRRVQSAVDVDEGFAFAREPACLGVGQPLRMREPARDLAVPIDLSQVVRRRHEREVHRAPLRRLAGLDELDVLAGGRQLLEVVDGLVVGRELVVGAGTEAEHRFGCRHAALREEGDRRRQQEHECQAEDRDSHAPSISQRCFARGRRPS